MHELGIAESIVRAVVAEATSRGAERVRAVDLEIASREGLRSEVVAAAFRLAAQGTVAEGALLRVRFLPETGDRSPTGWTIRSATMILRDP